MRAWALAIALLTGCTSGPATRIVWRDFTGAGRVNAHLQMDHGTCQLMRAQAEAQAVVVIGPPPPVPTCAGCAGLAFSQGYMHSAAISRYADDAYLNCMRSRGWEQIEEVMRQ